MNDDYLKRSEHMFLLHQLGATYKFIGNKFDICPARVGQILRKRKIEPLVNKNVRNRCAIESEQSWKILASLYLWCKENGITFNDSQT